MPISRTGEKSLELFVERDRDDAARKRQAASRKIGGQEHAQSYVGKANERCAVKVAA